MRGNLLRLILAISLCEGAGLLGSIFTFSTIPTWYANLNKSPISPPNWLFGPVWALLYALMGISLFLVWSSLIKAADVKVIKQHKIALLIFALQLILNTLWSVIFFGLKNPLLALAEIVLLWPFILLTIILFHKRSRKAALLLIPYLLWVSFASYLNFSIWLLN